jgi:hypothetical protein
MLIVMPDQDDFGIEWTCHTPTVNDDGTISLWGVGPMCPGCGESTHAVTADKGVEQPWWCQECNVRLDDDGGYGAQASFPADNDPRPDSIADS